MTHPPDIAVLTARIAKATVDCERWRASGLQDRYIEAFNDVEALEKQLETALRDHAHEGSGGSGTRTAARGSKN